MKHSSYYAFFLLFLLVMITIPIKVVPKSSRNEVVGWHGGELKVKVAAAPEKGLANKKLIAFMAKTLKVAKAQLSLVSGDTGRHKRLRIDGVDEEHVKTILGIPKV